MQKLIISIAVLVSLISCGGVQKKSEESELISNNTIDSNCELILLKVTNVDAFLERPDIVANNFEFDSLTHYWDGDTLIFNHYFMTVGTCLKPQFSSVEVNDTIYLSYKDQSNCDLATLCKLDSKVKFTTLGLTKSIIYKGKEVGYAAYQKDIEQTSTVAVHDKADIEYDAKTDYIAYLEEEWANVPNPFIAFYRGNAFGDYHHIMFEDENGHSYDFGDGNNSFGDCKLFFNDEHLNDNPKYLDKKMTIYWDWKESTFSCCDGEYELVTAKMPSIIKLELNE